LVVEILSPSSIRRDRYEKLEQYARFGVKEYWIVDPASHAFEILVLEDKRLVVHAIAAESGRVESKLLTGLTIDLTEVF
jgi:Uma2 family endonuclease